MDPEWAVSKHVLWSCETCIRWTMEWMKKKSQEQNKATPEVHVWNYSITWRQSLLLTNRNLLRSQKIVWWLAHLLANSSMLSSLRNCASTKRIHDEITNLEIWQHSFRVPASVRKTAEWVSKIERVYNNINSDRCGIDASNKAKIAHHISSRRVVARVFVAIDFSKHARQTCQRESAGFLFYCIK